jgi:hypothetical protein
MSGLAEGPDQRGGERQRTTGFDGKLIEYDGLRGKRVGGLSLSMGTECGRKRTASSGNAVLNGTGCALKSPCCAVVGRNRQDDETNEIRRERRLKAGSKWNLSGN